MVMIDKLTSLLGAGDVLTEQEDLVSYSFDGTATFRQLPRAVVFPRTTQEVAGCVKVCRESGTPVITRGAGTGLSGGTVPTEGAVVLCLVHMAEILEVDAANLTLRAEPGAITADIDAEAAKHGLFYPPDPGSMKISTIGGNVAENSGGLRGLKYGVTRDYVMEVTVVLPDGEVAAFGNRCVKDVAGYSMRDLFIGSEGTLGIITEVLLKLLPRPEARRTILATFASMEAAAETVSAIIAARIIPCTLEFLDQMTIRCVEDYTKMGLPTDCAALLLMETDGHPAAVADEAERMVEIARKHGAREVKTAADEVPRSCLAEMVAYIAETARKLELTVGTFGHMGDGNLHPTFLTDERNLEEMKKVHQALDLIVKKTLSLGGTITGEHGVGLAKKPWLRDQLGDVSLGLMKKFKETIDPENLLNPHKIFD